MTYARGMGIELSFEDSQKIHELWLESFPEMRRHLDPPVDEYWTRKNIQDYCRKHGIKLQKYNEDTLKSYLRQKFTEDGVENPGRAAFMEMKDLVRYIAKTVRGRVRSNCTFTSSANTVFQGLTSDGTKRALWHLIKAGYKIVVFVHDEIIVELDDDENLQHHVKEIERIMVESMEEVITRVKISVESALMRRWDKGAKTEYVGEDLQVWEDDEEMESVLADAPLF